MSTLVDRRKTGPVAYISVIPAPKRGPAYLRKLLNDLSIQFNQIRQQVKNGEVSEEKIRELALSIKEDLARHKIRMDDLDHVIDDMIEVQERAARFKDEQAASAGGRFVPLSEMASVGGNASSGPQEIVIPEDAPVISQGSPSGYVPFSRTIRLNDAAQSTQDEMVWVQDGSTSSFPADYSWEGEMDLVAQRFGYVIQEAERIEESERRAAVAASEKQRLDISDKLIGFRYEDSDEKSDKLVLTLRNFDLSLFDSKLLKRGNFLDVQWGYPGNMSPTRRCVIQRVKGSTTLTVEAMSMSMVMHTVKKTRVWENKTRGEIAKEIAASYGYETGNIFISEDLYQTKRETITQGNKTDAEFLKVMAGKQAQFFVDYDGFHFHKRKFNQPSVRRYIWYIDNRSELIDFDIDFDGVGGGGGVISGKGRDTIKKETYEVQASNEDTVREGLAEYQAILRHDPETRELSWDVLSKFELKALPDDNAEKAKERVDSEFIKGQQEVMKLTATVIGDPNLVAKSVVTFENISQTYSGAYYIKNAIHSFGNGSAYTIQLQCIRDGFNSGDSASASNAKKDEAKKQVDAANDPNAEQVLCHEPENRELSWGYPESCGRVNVEPGPMSSPDEPMSYYDEAPLESTSLPLSSSEDVSSPWKTLANRSQINQPVAIPPIPQEPKSPTDLYFERKKAINDELERMPVEVKRQVFRDPRIMGAYARGEIAIAWEEVEEPANTGYASGTTKITNVRIVEKK